MYGWSREYKRVIITRIIIINATTLTLATLNSKRQLNLAILTKPFSYCKNKFLTWEVTHRI